VRDWNALVRERLADAALPRLQRGEIVAELAGHLEEFYEEQCERGIPETEALNYALGQVTDWPKLARKIERAKRPEGKMNQNTRSFWLPAFITLTAWVLFEALLAQTSYGPRMVSAHSNMMLVIWPVWVVGQPFLGAIGAYMSRRAGGTRFARLAAGLFPMIITVVGIAAAYVATLIDGMLHGRNDESHIVLVSVAKFALGVVIIPGLALLLGTLPFLRSEKARVFVES
jgi:hypothetical protein